MLLLHHEQRDTHSGLRARVVRAVGEASTTLGFTPSVRMEGLVDTNVPREIADHVVAVLSEALTNIARHAHADRAQVVLTADGHEASLTVWDDGVGITPGGRRSGLRNMAERAEQLGGRFEVSSPEGAAHFRPGGFRCPSRRTRLPEPRGHPSHAASPAAP